ncbi:MAG TPA: flagellar biosynthesis protein FlhB [Fimbriimonadaceae bacterium]|nr:flagellar biosynthesis protein FlhB [Fimbriimonadaceae bacterium]
MAENDGQERTEDATPRRRADARKKGTVAKSVDLTGALVLGALVLVLPWALTHLGTQTMGAIRLALASPPADLGSASMGQYTWRLLSPALLALAAIAGTCLVVGTAANFMQVGFVMSGESMNPTFDKINPLQGFKRLFSARSFVEGLKTIIKSLLFGYIAYDAIASHWGDLMGLAWLTPAASIGVVGGLLHTIAIRIAIAWLVLAGLDYFFQRKQVDKQLKMTKDELRREMKEQEGSPEIKMAMAQRRRKLTKGRLRDRIRDADVVITNPEHYAVAIKYDRSEMHAPMVVAKGVDYLAQKIREEARAQRVAIVPNPPLARALYKRCEVGDFVPRELFQAVAEVLAYVYRTLKGMKAGAGS